MLATFGAGTTHRNIGCLKNGLRGVCWSGGAGLGRCWLAPPSPRGRWDWRSALSARQLHCNMYLKALKIPAAVKPPLPARLEFIGSEWVVLGPLGWAEAEARGWADWPLSSAQDAPHRRPALGLWPPSSAPGHTGRPPEPSSLGKRESWLLGRTGREGESPPCWRPGRGDPEAKPHVCGSRGQRHLHPHSVSRQGGGAPGGRPLVSRLQARSDLRRLRWRGLSQ